jgi:hypothetical protein
MSSTVETTRVIFTFDKDSLESLRKIQEKMGFKSLAETVRESLRLANSLREQAEQGYSELILRNPETNKERELVVDFLEKLRKIGS